MLNLYEHNQTAYLAAIDLMDRAGKAAIVHPTGTGKSVIAFKLVEAYAEKRICWLSPSVYIIHTQRENVCHLDPNFTDDNVSYYTYAKLMNMDVAELQGIQPDYIILDEFHRCGAAEWCKGVQALLQMYPQAKLPGLTATSIRYLDNQRDMADELFDGNVASEITIAEAIATGILPIPKYVTALYSYQEELAQLERRVNSVRHRANYDANRQYLDALHRALEYSLGLDEIFEKHIRDRAGKYIVFCSGKEHMNAVRVQIPEWFSRIDQNPHIYCVLSEDLGSEESFAQFKRDSSPHLKLLLCVDMLSEGIHVDDIDGVILLRPTISPIVYKQQIGRALAAGKQGRPLIFDIVNNFDNLHSVSALRDEISAIRELYRERGEGEQLVDEAFWVCDEVRECRELFDRLETSLSATWDINFLAARAYYESFGNLNVPADYRTDGNICLGNWISYQRRLYHGKHHGSLTEERIERLNRIGMIWENRYEQNWETMFSVAEDYYIEHGDLSVPASYKTEDGILLGKWLRRQADGRAKLSDDRIERLNSIGMVWTNQWEARYQIAQDFLRDHPGYTINQGTVIGDFWIGKWLVQQMRAYEKKTLQPYQADLMRTLIAETGLSAESANQKKQRESYEKAKQLVEKYGSWKASGLTAEEKKISQWIRRLIRKAEAGKTTPNERQLLSQLGVVQDKEISPWMKYYALAKQYHLEHGNLKIHAHYTTEDGTRLGAWISRQRGLYKSNTLTAQQIELLEAIGMEWGIREERMERGMRSITRFYEMHGNLDVPLRYKDEDGFPLYQWMYDIRRGRTQISEDKAEILTQMGFEWRLSEQIKVDRVHSEIRTFLESGNSPNIAYSVRTENGFPIGRYLAAIRKERQSGKHRYLTPELQNLLELHEMQWEK